MPGVPVSTVLSFSAGELVSALRKGPDERGGIEYAQVLFLS